jgi:hypothetical protein
MLHRMLACHRCGAVALAKPTQCIKPTQQYENARDDQIK